MQATGFNAELGRQQFLELMVTQLQYQDPLQPVGQQEFLQQLAQFSVVEGVEQLNTQFADYLKVQTLSQGVDFVGQHVEYESASGESLSGRVSEVRVINGQMNLQIGDDLIPLQDVNALISLPE